MSARDEVNAALDAEDAEQFAAGAASRDAEVNGLKAQEVADIQTIAGLRAQLAAVPQPSRVVLDVDWAGLPDGPYTRAMHQARFPNDTANPGPTDAYFAAHNVTIKNGCLQVTIPAGQYGTSVNPAWFGLLGESLLEASVTQVIEFVTGFDFAAGGKCGFGVGSTDTAANPPSGGETPTNGCSLTPMWRSPGIGSSGGRPAGSAFAYSYPQSPKSSNGYGYDEALEQVYPIGAPVTQHATVRLNDVGQANGHLSACFDGTAGMSRDDYEWRNAADQLLNRIRFAVFRGGATSAWASTTPGVIRFHRVTITTPGS